MNLSKKLATVALTGVMVAGGASTAFARGNHTPAPPVDDACIIYLTGSNQPSASSWNYLGDWTNAMGVRIGGRYLIPCPNGTAPGTEIKPGHPNRPNRPNKPAPSSSASSSSTPTKNRPAPAATTPARKHPVTGAESALFAVGGSLLAAAGGTVLAAKRRNR